MTAFLDHKRCFDTLILNPVLMTKIYIREQICTCVNLPEIYSRV